MLPILVRSFLSFIFYCAPPNDPIYFLLLSYLQLSVYPSVLIHTLAVTSFTSAPYTCPWTTTLRRSKLVSYPTFFLLCHPTHIIIQLRRTMTVTGPIWLWLREQCLRVQEGMKMESRRRVKDGIVRWLVAGWQLKAAEWACLIDGNC